MGQEMYFTVILSQSPAESKVPLCRDVLRREDLFFKKRTSLHKILGRVHVHGSRFVSSFYSLPEFEHLLIAEGTLLSPLRNQRFIF